MAYKVQVGPPQIAIHQAMTVLVTEPDGQINWPSDNGLYFFDTRVISAWSVYANGESWILVNGVVTFTDGVATGATPGQLLRHGAAT